MFGIPLNRIVAFVGPYISVASGAIATWLFVHVHFLALFHTTHTQVAGAITQVAVFGLTTAVTWLGHNKWLSGHIQFEALVANSAAQDAHHAHERWMVANDIPSSEGGSSESGSELSDADEFSDTPPESATVPDGASVIGGIAPTGSATGTTTTEQNLNITDPPAGTGG